MLHKGDKCCCISKRYGEGELMSDYSVMLLLGIFCWIVASYGDSRNSTVNTVILGISTVLMIFLKLLKVI